MKVRSAVFAITLMMLIPLAARGVEKGYTVFHGSREERRVAVTVDDCYNAAHVQEILDLGCEIGNHTWSRARLPELNSRDIKRQLRKTQERLNAVLGFDYPMGLMRPPYGRLSSRSGQISEKWVVEAIEEAGYIHAVRWDVSQTDPARAIPPSAPSAACWDWKSGWWRTGNSGQGDQGGRTGLAEKRGEAPPSEAILLW